MKNKALLIVRVRFSHTFWRIFFSVLEMRHCLCQHKNTLGFGDDRLSPHGSAGGGGGCGGGSCGRCGGGGTCGGLGTFTLVTQPIPMQMKT